jgi:DNA-binding response OmpR family regulator
MPALMTRTILIVEDRPEIQTLLGAVVRRQGFEPVMAQTGAQALACLDRAPVLVFADLGLPDMSGVELVRELRCRAGLERTPVVVITAHADGAGVLAAAKLGEVEVVIKPFRFDQIAGIIERYLGAGS